MFGDIVLWFKEFFKQQTCVHHYEIVYRKDTGGDFLLCSKCNKIH